MKKWYFILILFFCFLMKSNVYAGNEDEIFLYVGEKYVIEQQEGVLATYTSENEEIAAMEEQVITGKSSGETYIVVNNNGVEKRLHIFVGDYKLCTGQEELMEFDLSSVMNAWDSSIRSSDTSVVSAVKQGHDKNEVSFLFKAVSTGMANITISSGSTVLESFAVVVQNHPLAYFERIEPTCSQKGSIAHYECLFCSKCFSDADGQECLDDISIDESEHEYETKEVKPDCVNQGYTEYTCKRCGDSFRNSYIDAPGHNFKTVFYMNYNSVAKQSCAACGAVSYKMNIEGVMVNQSFYPRKWDADSSNHYVPLNEEWNVPIDLDAYGKKYITFTFPKSDVKKKRELYQGVWINTDYVYWYSY